MSDEDELVVVDTADGTFDPAPQEDPLVIDPSVNSDSKPKQPTTNQLTYDNNPYGILVCSKFKVRSDIEEIPDSLEKRCHFSVEGNEISIKFPLRGEDTSTMRDEGARKVIDFIMSLDRVPARLAEFMSVPNKQVKRAASDTPVEATKKRRGKRGGGQDRLLVNTQNITAELMDAGLPPKFIQAARRAGNSQYKWKVTTLLPGVDVEFVGLEETSLSAKLTSLVKAIAFAKTHGLGGFADRLEPAEDILYEQNEHSFPPTRYPRQSNYHRPQQRHVSVHARLMPPLNPSPRYFEDDYPPPAPEPLAPPGPFFEYFEDTPDLDYPAYPTPYFPIAPRRPPYIRGASWRTARGRGRRGQFISKRGKLIKNESL